MKTLALVLAFASCGPDLNKIGEHCTTNAGIKITGGESQKGWCDTVQDVEDRTLEAFKRMVTYADDRFFAPDLSAWSVQIYNSRSWLTPNGTSVAGLTDCYNKLMFVGSDPPAWGSFGHEMAHAIQNCEPKPPLEYDPNDPQVEHHSNWGPIYAALKDAQVSPP